MSDVIDSSQIDLEALVSHIDILSYINQYIDSEKELNGEVWYHCPFHTDDTESMSVNQDKQLWFCLSCKQGGNVYNFAKLYHKFTAEETVIHLCRYANLDVSEVKAPPDVLKYLRKLSRTFNKKENNSGYKVLNKDCMLIYEHRPIKEWLNEGISQDILDKYLVRYNDLDNSIVFPIYDNAGNIINIKKRTLDKDYSKKKKPKYVYLNKLGTLSHLYGFAQNKGRYNDYKSLILFEGEKSVMKLESIGLYCSVALGTSSITKEQANALIKTGKNIVICMDKGVSLNDIRQRFAYLIRFTNTYVVIDNYGLLDEKDSPIDKGYDIFKQLYNKKIRL